MRRRTPVQHGPPGAPAGGPIRAPVRAGQKIDVQLAWARDRDGHKVHVARLEPKDRKSRAPFTCLGCGDVLVPHLGRVRARHFAHAPGSQCPLTAPETALHLDAKEKLLALCEDAFAGRRAVTVLARCPGCRRPAPLDLGAEGDRAVAEGAVGALRADVLVLRGGAPRLAFEVKVTHAVEPEKEAALAAAAVPAVEIDAREPWLEEPADAPGESRVIVVRSLGFAPCAGCTTQARAAADRGRGGEAAEIAELEAYRARGLFGPSPRSGGGPGGRAGGAGHRSPAGDAAGAGHASSGGAGGAGHAAPAPRRGAGHERTDSPDGAGHTVPDGEAPLDEGQRTELAARFRCPECGGQQIQFGERIARHACPGAAPRPIAWRGYDGVLVELSWWRQRDRPGPAGARS
jgi:ribosomal protein S27E